MSRLEGAYVTLDEAIALLDGHVASQGQDVLTVAWKVVRGDARRGRRISSQALPAASLAVQHAQASIEHAEKAIESLGGMVAGRSEPPPPSEDG